MARVFFGRVLAITAFVVALWVGAGWVTRDRPSAWLAHVAGEEAPPAAQPMTAEPAGSPDRPVAASARGIAAPASARGARLAHRPAAR